MARDAVLNEASRFGCMADAAALPPCVGRGVCNLDELAAAGGIDADPNVALADVVFVCNSSVAANMTFTSRGLMRNVTLVSGRGGLALLTAHSPAVATAAAPSLANYFGGAPTNEGTCELEYGLTFVSLKGMSNVTVALSSNSTSKRAVRIQSYLGVAHSLLMLINGTFVANVGESVALVDYAHQAFVGMAGIGINNATSIERIAFVSANASFVRATGGRADGGGLNITAPGGAAVVAGIGVAIAVANVGATTRINDVSVVAFDTIVSLRPIAFSDPGTSAVVGALGVAIHYPIMTPAQFAAAGGVSGKPILTAYGVHVNVTGAPLILLDSISYASHSAASSLVGGVGIATLAALQSASVVVEAKSALHVAAVAIWRLGASVFGAGMALSGPVTDASAGRVAAADVRVVFASNSSLAVDAVTVVPPWTFTVNYGKVVFSAVVGVGVAMTACDVGPMPAQSALGADEALGTTAVIIVTLNASASLFLGTTVLPAQALIGAVGVATLYSTAYREYSYYPISTSTMAVVSANRQWALIAVTVSGGSRVSVSSCVTTQTITVFVGAVGIAAYRVSSIALSWMTLPAAVPTTSGAASWSVRVTSASTIALTNISYGNDSSTLVGAVGVAAVGSDIPVSAASIGVLIDDAVQIMLQALAGWSDPSYPASWPAPPLPGVTCFVGLVGVAMLEADVLATISVTAADVFIAATRVSTRAVDFGVLTVGVARQNYVAGARPGATGSASNSSIVAASTQVYLWGFECTFTCNVLAGMGLAVRDERGRSMDRVVVRVEDFADVTIENPIIHSVTSGSLGIAAIVAGAGVAAFATTGTWSVVVNDDALVWVRAASFPNIYGQSIVGGVGIAIYSWSRPTVVTTWPDLSVYVGGDSWVNIIDFLSTGSGAVAFVGGVGIAVTQTPDFITEPTLPRASVRVEGALTEVKVEGIGPLYSPLATSYLYNAVGGVGFATTSVVCVQCVVDVTNGATVTVEGFYTRSWIISAVGGVGAAIGEGAPRFKPNMSLQVTVTGAAVVSVVGGGLVRNAATGVTADTFALAFVGAVGVAGGWCVPNAVSVVVAGPDTELTVTGFYMAVPTAPTWRMTVVLGCGLSITSGDFRWTNVAVSGGAVITVSNVTLSGTIIGAVFGAGYAVSTGAFLFGSVESRLAITDAATIIDVSDVRLQPAQRLRDFVLGAGIVVADGFAANLTIQIASAAAIRVANLAFPETVQADLGTFGVGFTFANPSLSQFTTTPTNMTLVVSGAGTLISVRDIDAAGAIRPVAVVGTAGYMVTYFQSMNISVAAQARVIVTNVAALAAQPFASVGVSVNQVSLSSVAVNVASGAEVHVASLTVNPTAGAAIGGVGFSVLGISGTSAAQLQVVVSGGAVVAVSNLSMLPGDTVLPVTSAGSALVAAVGWADWETAFGTGNMFNVVRVSISDASVSARNISITTNTSAVVGGVGYAGLRSFIAYAEVSITRSSLAVVGLRLDGPMTDVVAFVGGVGHAFRYSTSYFCNIRIAHSSVIVSASNATVTGAAVGGAGMAVVAPADGSTWVPGIQVIDGSEIIVSEFTIYVPPWQPLRAVPEVAGCVGILLDGYLRGGNITIAGASTVTLTETSDFYLGKDDIDDDRGLGLRRGKASALVAIVGTQGYFYSSDASPTWWRILINVSEQSYVGPCPAYGTCLLASANGVWNEASTYPAVNVSIGGGALLDACAPHPPPGPLVNTVDLRPRIAANVTTNLVNMAQVVLTSTANIFARRPAQVFAGPGQRVIVQTPGALAWRPCSTWSRSTSVSSTPTATRSRSQTADTRTRTSAAGAPTLSLTLATVSASEGSGGSPSASGSVEPTPSGSASNTATRTESVSLEATASASISVSATATIPFVFPIPELVQAPTVKTGGVVAASGATSAVLAGALSSGGAAAGGIARTLGVVAALGRIASSSRGSCKGADADATLMATDSPLQLTLGDPPDYVTGAAVGAPAMVLAVGAFCAVVSLLGRWVLRCAVTAPHSVDDEVAEDDEEMITRLHVSVPSASERLKAPVATSVQVAVTEASLTNVAQVTFAGVFLTLSMLTTPAVTYALMRAVAESDTADPDMARWRVPLAGACALLMCAALLGFSVAAAVAARPGGALRFVAFKPPRPGPPNESLRVRLNRWWRRAWRPEGEWVEGTVAEGGGTSSDVSWGSVLLSVVDGYRGPRAWFCVVDAAFQVLLGVAAAAAEFTADDGMVSCAATAWATVAASSIYVALLVAARPHRTRAQWYTVVLANALVLAIAFAMAFVVQRAWADRVMPDYTTLLGLAAAAQCLAFVQAIQELALQIVDLIAAWRGGSLWQLLLRSQLRRQKAIARMVREPLAARSAPVRVTAAPVTDFARLEWTVGRAVLPINTPAPVPPPYGSGPAASASHHVHFPMTPRGALEFTSALVSVPGDKVGDDFSVSTSDDDDVFSDAFDSVRRDREEQLRRLLEC